MDSTPFKSVNCESLKFNAFKFVKFEIGSILVIIECFNVKFVSDSICDIECKCSSLNGANKDVNVSKFRFSIGAKKSPFVAIAL